jgi:hypothetical protein
MEAPKLIIQVTANHPTVIYDDRSTYITGGGSGPFYGLRPADQTLNMFFLMGIVSSKVFGYYVRQQSTPLRGGYYKFSKQYIQSFPIRTIDFTSPADVARHDQVVTLVERMLELHRKLAAEQVPHARTVLQRQIDATDRQIDALVYELYGLTDAEIAIVEGR